MAMKRVFIANAKFEVANNKPGADISPLALVLMQGKAYAQYRILKRYKLIDVEQSKAFIRSLDMPAGALELLKATDIRSLDLRMIND